MTLRTLILDDEPLAHKVILEYAKDISFIDIVGQCYLATEALAMLNKQPVDLIFLDIQMPKLKGLDFLRIHKSFIINRKHIHYVEGNSVVLQNGQRLPIGKSYRPAFKDFISNVL